MNRSAIYRGVLAACLCLSAFTVPAQEDQPPQRKLDITLNAKITVFTEPLREDGTIDYVTAINDHSRKGVTNENNAFRDLWMLLNGEFDPDHPNAADPEDVMWHLGQTCKALGIQGEELKAAPHYVQWWDQAEAAGFDPDDLYELDAEELLGPIDTDLLRHYVKWLKAAEPSFAFAAKAVDKQRYWAPMMGGDDAGLVVAVLLPHLGEHRSLARGLQAWAYYTASQGDFDQTLQAIDTLRKLAWHQSHEWSLISSLVAISIEALTMETIRELVAHQLLDEERLAELDRLLRARPDRVPLAETIGMGETCFGLDAYMQILAGRVTTGALMGGLGGGGGDGQGPVDKIMASGAFDVNRGLKQLRMHYLQLYRISKIQDYAMRTRLNEQFYEQVGKEQLNGELFIEVGDARVPNPALLVSVESRTDALTSLFTAIMLPALDAATNTETRFMAGERCTFTAIAVERYRLKHNTLPRSLDALVPGFLEAVPSDTFVNEPLRYKTTDKGFIVYSVNDNMADDGGIDDRNRDDNDWVITIDYKEQ